MAVDFEKYNNRFNEKIESIKAGPVKDRECNDICCIACFGIFFGLFIGLTFAFIIEGSQYLSELGTAIGSSDTTELGAIFGKTVPQVVGMIMLSIGLSIIFIALASKFPKCVAYSCIFGTLLIYVVLIIVGIVADIPALAVVFAIVLLINLLILWCYWEWIQVGIVILKVSGDFITEKPSVYFISLITLVLCLIFEVLWIVGYLAGYSETLPANNDSEDSRNTYSNLLILYYVIGIFFGFFLYYCMVFVTAMAVAKWYYKEEDNNVLGGFSTLRYHLGSITFGSIIITIITIARRAAQESSQEGGGGALALVMCILACLLSCIEDLVKVLNHNAIIVMAVTSEDYIDSAKSAISIIFENFGVFVIVDFFTDFLGIYSVIVCVLFPAILGGVLINAVENDAVAAVIGGVLIFILAWITSSVILGMLEEVISCVFIFYCFDAKFRSQGIPIDNIPKEMKDLFDDAGQGRGVEQYNNRANPRANNRDQSSEMQMYPQQGGGFNLQQGNAQFQGGYPQQGGHAYNQPGGYPQQGRF